MQKHSTSIRLEPRLYREVIKEARKSGLNFSTVVHLLLRAFAEGTVEIGITQFPKPYLERLGKEAEALRISHRKGKAKSFASSKELFDDILER